MGGVGMKKEPGREALMSMFLFTDERNSTVGGGGGGEDQ